jgi:hypothetical protein
MDLLVREVLQGHQDLLAQVAQLDLRVKMVAKEKKDLRAVLDRLAKEVKLAHLVLQDQLDLQVQGVKLARGETLVSLAHLD